MTWHDDHITIGRPYQMEKAQDSWDSFIQGTAYVTDPQNVKTSTYPSPVSRQMWFE